MKDKLNLLHVCARIPFPVEDGGSVYVYNTMKGLHAIGYQLHIASFESELHTQDSKGLSGIAHVYSEKGGFTEYSMAAAIKSALTREVMTVQHRMSLKVMEKILNQIKQVFDLILLEGLHTAKFIDLLRKKFPSVPILLRHVNVEYELILQRSESQSNPLLSRFLKDQAALMKEFEYEVLSNVDAVSFISEIDKQKLFDAIPDQTPTIISPPGTDISSGVPFLDRPEQTIVAFSNWKWTPNREGILWFVEKVWPQIISNNQMVKLILAGNDLPSSLRNNLPERVEYVGFVDDLYALNRNATLQVVPLLSGSGVKLKVIEGMAYGNPIVTTSKGVDGIAISDSVHCLIAEDAASFADKVLELLSDPGRRETLSREATRLIQEQYSWQSQISRLDTFIRSLIGK